MSFLITLFVNEGIVMASDSRTTYTFTGNVNGQIIQKIGVHTTESAEKTFLCPNNVGISTCGESSLMGMPITGFIQSFIREKVTDDIDVCSIPAMLRDYFRAFDPIPNTNFIVAGYHVEESGVKQKIFKVRIAEESDRKSVEDINTMQQGATWDGEIITLSRLINPLAAKQPDGKYLDLPNDDILWNYFTLQDAVDFAKYAVETTIKTMHFQNVVETVGGNVDILVITPEGSKWLSVKELHS